MGKPGRPRGGKNSKTKPYSFWSYQEERKFAEIYCLYGNEDLCKMFNKSIASIRTKSRELGLRKIGTTKERPIENLDYVKEKAGVYYIRCAIHQRYPYCNNSGPQIYIGYASNIKYRLKSHISVLNSKNRKPKTNKELYEDFQKYGIDNFVYSVIKYTDDAQEAMLLEHEYLKGMLPVLYNKYKNSKIPKLTKQEQKRFLAKIKQTDSCWNWNNGISNDGYGIVNIHYKEYAAHRIAYFLHYDIDPGPLSVLHSCDNKLCCNPDHLTLGTDKENALEARKRIVWSKCKRHGQFTKDDVEKMIELRKQRRPYKDIANEFNTHTSTIAHILTGKFKYLQGYVKDFDTTKYVAKRVYTPPKNGYKRKSGKTVHKYGCTDICIEWMKTLTFVYPHSVDLLYDQYLQMVSDGSFISNITGGSKDKAMYKPLSYGTFRSALEPHYNVVYVPSKKGFFITQ